MGRGPNGTCVLCRHEQAEEIAKDCLSGMTQRDIANKWNTSQGMVSKHIKHLQLLAAKEAIEKSTDFPTVSLAKKRIIEAGHGMAFPLELSDITKQALVTRLKEAVSMVRYAMIAAYHQGDLTLTLKAGEKYGKLLLALVQANLDVQAMSQQAKATQVRAELCALLRDETRRSEKSEVNKLRILVEKMLEREQRKEGV